ncbi:MAG: hypothetical protein V1495_04530 [Pseudomonadota bacterium]
MKKALWILIFLSVLAPEFAQARVYIDINQVSTDSFPIAVVPPYRVRGDEDRALLNDDFAKTVRNDLELMGVFRRIEPKAFIESPTKQGLTPAEIDFASWALLDALALVKGWYRVDGKKLTIEAHLYDVLSKTELVAKRYDSTVDRAVAIGHRFANEIMQILTGESGLFDTKIAFVCQPKGPKELCVTDFDGSNVRQLTRYGSIVLSPAWELDGKTIFFTSFAGAKVPQLFRVGSDGSGVPSKLASLPGLTIGLSIDPTEPLLATTLTKDGNPEIYLLTLAGTLKQRLTTNNDIDVSASFSPDGKHLTFVSNRDGSPQVYKMDRNGENVQRLTFKGANNTAPAWSPRGDKIAFAGLDTDGEFDIFTMNIDGSGMMRLTYDTRDNQEPKWAPGGQLITFASKRTGHYQIWSMRPDGTKQMQLTREPWDHTMPVWGPRTVK